MYLSTFLHLWNVEAATSCLTRNGYMICGTHFEHLWRKMFWTLRGSLILLCNYSSWRIFGKRTFWTCYFICNFLPMGRPVAVIQIRTLLTSPADVWATSPLVLPLFCSCVLEGKWWVCHRASWFHTDLHACPVIVMPTCLKLPRH